MEKALHGNLTVFTLPEVIRFLAQTRKTGTLRLTSEGAESWLHMEGGALVSARSTQEHLELDTVIAERKALGDSQRKDLSNLMARAGDRFWSAAISQKIVDEEKMHELVRIHVSEIVIDALGWETGEFEFSKMNELPANVQRETLDVDDLVGESNARAERRDKMRQLFPDPRVVFSVVGNPGNQDKITLSRQQWKILFQVNGQKSLATLAAESDEDPADLYAILHDLLQNELIVASSVPEIATMRLPKPEKRERGEASETPNVAVDDPFGDKADTASDEPLEAGGGSGAEEHGSSLSSSETVRAELDPKMVAELTAMVHGGEASQAPAPAPPPPQREETSSASSEMTIRAPIDKEAIAELMGIPPPSQQKPVAPEPVPEPTVVAPRTAPMPGLPPSRAEEPPAPAPAPRPAPAAPAPEASAPSVSPAPAPSRGSGPVTAACLTVENNDRDTFPLIEDEYFIGREASNSIQLPDASVSGVHARVVKTDEGYLLEDLKSRNGTFVNGERIDKKVLEENDMIRLGRVQLVYNIAGEVKVSPATLYQPRP